MSFLISPVGATLVSVAIATICGATFMYACLKAADKIKKSTDHVLEKKES